MKTDEELKKENPEMYRIARTKGTEPAFSGKYTDEKEKGMYMCAVCGAELFSSDMKFDSGTGWPSFTEPANTENIVLNENSSRGIKRTEVLCKKCGAHLGHIFDDGPASLPDGKKGTGQRFCINSCVLDLKKD